MKQLFFTVLAMTIFFSSCTIEKRHYMSGYHVEWNHKLKNEQRPAENEVLTHKSESLAGVIKGDIYLESNTTEPLHITRVNLVELLNSEQAIAENKVNSEVEKSRHRAAARPVLMEHKMSVGKHRNSFKANSALSPAAVYTESTQSSRVDDILLIILAIFISPLAVFLHEGSWNTTCWINLILWLLFILPGFIHALIVILG